MRVMWALLGRCRGAQLAAGGHECNGKGAESSSALVGRPATRYFSGCPRWALLCRCALRSRAHVLSRAAALRRAMACCSPSSGDDGRSHADKRPGRQGGHTCINAHIGLHLWLLRARASLPKRLLAARPFNATMAGYIASYGPDMQAMPCQHGAHHAYAPPLALRAVVGVLPAVARRIR